jgi:hypothetical protein
MNESTFNVLTRGGEKEREHFLDSFRAIKGAKEVNRPSEDVVTFRVDGKPGGGPLKDVGDAPG